MNYDIVSSEGDVNYCVKSCMHVYIVLKLCADVEGQGYIVQCTGQLDVWDGCWKASPIIP